MALTINKLTNANIYLDNKDMLGRAEEITLPDVTYKMTEHEGLGLLGSMEFFSGIEKMEASIKWSAVYADTAGYMADPFKAIALSLHGNLQTWDTSGVAQEQPYKVWMKGTFKNFPTGMFKKSENVDITTKFNVYSIKVEFGGKVQFEFDATTNKLASGGKDLTAKYKANLGK